MKTAKLKLLGGKKLRNVKDKLDRAKTYSLAEAIKFLQDNTFVKFDETLEVAIKLGIDTEHSDQNVRGIVQLPHGTGKKVRVAAFVNDRDVAVAKKAGADVVGLEDLIDEVKKENIQFDICVATPDVMSKVSAVAKVLGPKGMMPNPKLGTVGPNIAEIIKQVKTGQVEFCMDKAGIVHMGAGKLSFTLQALEDNVKALVGAIVRAKPAGAKIPYIVSAFVTSTMGPSLKVETSGFK